MKLPKPPREFTQLAVMFIRETREGTKTPEEWIDAVVARKSRVARQISKRYITQLLESGASDDELQRIWDSTNPTYGFRGVIRRFLTALRDAL